MKIAEISAFNRYSVGKIMSDIQQYINANVDDNCTIFYARGKADMNSNLFYFGNKMSTYISCFFARLVDNDGFSPITKTKNLIKLLDRFKPDIIHLHCLHGYYLNVEILFNYLLKNDIKVVWTIHDCWPFTGHCCYFPKNTCDKWITCCNHCPMKSQYPKSIFLDNSNKNYIKKRNIFTLLNDNRMYIVTPSYWLEQTVKQSYLKKYVITTIKNGIDINIYNRNNICTLKTKHKILLGVASVWDDRKGINTFFELSKNIPNNWEIWIVGVVKNKKNIDGTIKFIDRIEDINRLKSFYANCNVLLNPTENDVFGMVNLEAQACGAKVLCKKVGGTPETQIGNLYLYDDLNTNELWEMILKIDKEKINKLENIDFSSTFMAKQYYNLFNKIIKKGEK